MAMYVGVSAGVGYASGYAVGYVQSGGNSRMARQAARNGFWGYAFGAAAQLGFSKIQGRLDYVKRDVFEKAGSGYKKIGTKNVPPVAGAHGVSGGFFKYFGEMFGGYPIAEQHIWSMLHDPLAAATYNWIKGNNHAALIYPATFVNLTTGLFGASVVSGAQRGIVRAFDHDGELSLDTRFRVGVSAAPMDLWQGGVQTPFIPGVMKGKFNDEVW